MQNKFIVSLKPSQAHDYSDKEQDELWKASRASEEKELRDGDKLPSAEEVEKWSKMDRLKDVIEVSELDQRIGEDR